MTPTPATGDRRYRYYVSKALHEGSAARPAPGVRIPAAELAQLLASKLAQLLADPLELAHRIQLDLRPHTLQLLLTRCQQFSGQLTAQGLAAVPCVWSCPMTPPLVRPCPPPRCSR